ncbi:MAG: PHP-associated domain-containing protein [Candidatus Krumholzibacteriia bacterium]
MKVDLHIHTSERSGCAESPAVDMLTAAVRAGLDAVAITDHHRLVPAADLAVLAARFPQLLLIPGIEITLDEEAEDILVLGLDEPRLARGAWTWPDLRAFAREHGGLTVLAHPFRYDADIGIDLASQPPDAIEIHSTNIRPAHHAEIRRTAARYGLPVVADSDAHSARSVGRYANRLHEPAPTVLEVLAAIREGRFTPESSP